jgi:hypothetical protein
LILIHRRKLREEESNQQRFPLHEIAAPRFVLFVLFVHVPLEKYLTENSSVSIVWHIVPTIHKWGKICAYLTISQHRSCDVDAEKSITR